MIKIRNAVNFPKQKVSRAEKNKPEWYANCIDYIIQEGLSLNDRDDTETMLDILHGNIPDSYYRKTLNPYNSDKEKYRRFPATMRNLDIMSDIVRRYVSEYFKGIHEFITSASNPNIALKKEARLQQEVLKLAEQAFQAEVQNIMAQMQQQAQEQGQPLDENAMQQAIPDVEEFVKNFQEKYISDETIQAQEMLGYIRSITQDVILYLSAYMNFCSLGECYTYTEVINGQFRKENVPVNEAYPIPTNEFFVEDHDMFARKMLWSYDQIVSKFKYCLSKEDLKFLDEYYYEQTPSGTKTQLLYSKYFEYSPDLCSRFTDEERKLFKDQPVVIHAENNNLFEVWHVVWKGVSKKGILTRVNQEGFPETLVVEDDYELNPEAGDVDIQYEYDTQIYEGYRIGTRYTGIYPIKARPLPYNRDNKLPYNGIMEILPLMGKFSIIRLVTPFQIMRNIVSYHRELVIAKNKMLILLLPESLINEDPEDKIYKMAADGVLLLDDSEDTSGQKAQAIRLLNANLGNYISELTNLMESIKQEAWGLVDMNMQRYGDIAQSAGVGVTQEAIARSSMGSVIIVTVFDEMRKRDYQRDLDYAKFAYIDGLEDSYVDDKNKTRTLSLDVNSYVNSAYSVYCKNDQKELDKMQQLKQWAFSAAQNGDIEMAKEAIVGDNITQISAAIDKFGEIKRKHEEDIKAAEQQLEQAKLQNKLAEIQAKGEEDRKTEELKYYYEMQLKNMDVDMQSLVPNNNAELQEKNRIQEQAYNTKADIDREKLELEKQKTQLEMYNKAADREIKREDMNNKLKIARENKNKYDKK